MIDQGEYGSGQRTELGDEVASEESGRPKDGGYMTRGRVPVHTQPRISLNPSIRLVHRNLPSSGTLGLNHPARPRLHHDFMQSPL